MEWIILKIRDLKKGVWLEEEIYRIIANHFEIESSQIRMKRKKWNKPFLEMKDLSKAYFNYSHTKNYLLIGFSDYFEIGVDVEEINSGHKSIGLIIECLAEEERRYIEELEKQQQREALLKIWVQKEAIGKAIGVGLLYDTTSLTVRYDLDVHSEHFNITFYNRELVGIVWREEEFWACIACVRSMEMEVKMNES